MVRNKFYNKIVILIILAVFAGGFALFYSKQTNSEEKHIAEEPVIVEPQDRLEEVLIEDGQTFSTIVEEVGLGGSTMIALINASAEVYDLASVRAGRSLYFYFDHETDEFNKLMYPINSEEELFVELNDLGEWEARREAINYEIRIREVGGTINSSLYVSALEQDLDERAIIELADVFQWTVDFGVGIRQGDTYQFIFEERYRNGQYVMPGKILAARFVNDGREVEGYYYEEKIDEEGDPEYGYYAPDGSSLQKLFLKSPVSYKYISSGFTTGARYVAEFKVYTSSHRAIDYAASSGTPVRSVGNGTVTFSGWNSSGYGNFITIRHNDTYSTNYAHLSKLYVSRGEHVEQGEIIGAVGSTGFSTGPHLHYEMVKYGTKINPLTVELPSDKALVEESLPRFQEDIKQWQERLKNINTQ